MTREEAISVLRDMRLLSALPKRIEALDMAIAALREQGGSFQNGNDHNTVKDWPPYMDLPREQETVTNRNGLTNAQKICSMTDEELADYMSEHSIDDFCYIICGGECKAVATFNKTAIQRCREIVLDWLKQPYEEEDNE